MKTWTIVALVLSAGVIALGIALADGQRSPVGTSLVILGGGGAAVSITLWATHVLGFGRVLAKRRRDSARIDRLITKLTDCAKQAESRGVLTLVECELPERRALFSAGVEMLVNADSPANIRMNLGQKAERECSTFHASRARITTICRIVPVISIGMALVTMFWMLLALASGRQAAELGSLTPLVLIIAVYGAFAIAAISVEIGERVAAVSAEDELAGALVIETIAAIRSGESPDRVAAILKGLTPPPREVHPHARLRRAA
jgi:flagellar motor component MotA